MNRQQAHTRSSAPATPQTNGAARKARRPDLDWLRTLIVLAIIPYHALVLYTVASGTVILHPAAATWTAPLYRALEEWGILFIFLLAGAASVFALRSRSLGAYAWERALRLLVPLSVVALLFAPVRSYYLALANPALLHVSPVPISHPERMRNIGIFFLEYWRILFTTGSTIVSRNPIAHLWFVPRLIAVSLVSAPLIQALRRRWPEWAERVGGHWIPATALLVGGGLIPTVVTFLLEPGWLNRLTVGFPLADNWSAFTLCLYWFITGALIYASSRLLQAARELAYVTLTLALAGGSVAFGIMLSGHAPAPDYSAGSLLYTTLRIFSIWLLTLGVLGLGARFLNVSLAWQPGLVAAAFPVYLLHLPLLLATAYYLQYLPLPWPTQMTLAIIIALPGSFALYTYVVRRVPAIGLLFGVPNTRPARPSVIRNARLSPP
ncbi:MAG TPA: acyltransferase family protein [Ktedonobacterales bacterium]